MPTAIDEAVLNFDASSLMLMNVCLALIMFGIALDLSKSSFTNVFLHTPRSILTGLSAQLIVLPLLTFGLIWLIKPLPSIALGMIMVASCPGGNISNFMSQQAGGNAALSIGLTSISSLASIFFTPFNLAFYGSRYAPTAAILQQVNLDWLSVTSTILLIIILPTFVGMSVRYYRPELAKKLKNPLTNLSFIIFTAFVVIALASNFSLFIQFVYGVFFLVLLHNVVAFLAGYGMAKVMMLKKEDVKSITIETGIQNSGLGLLLIFGYFNGLGGMAILTAWWGIWHIISGTALSLVWRDTKVQA